MMEREAGISIENLRVETQQINSYKKEKASSPARYTIYTQAKVAAPGVGPQWRSEGNLWMAPYRLQPAVLGGQLLHFQPSRFIGARQLAHTVTQNLTGVCELLDPPRQLMLV
jgi:hypothetical protein